MKDGNKNSVVNFGKYGWLTIIYCLMMYGVAMCFVVGGIMSAGYIAGGTLVAQWFPKKKGVVMG